MFTHVTGVTQIKGKSNRMKITYYGHSSFAAEINGKHLLTLHLLPIGGTATRRKTCDQRPTRRVISCRMVSGCSATARVRTRRW